MKKFAALILCLLCLLSFICCKAVASSVEGARLIPAFDTGSRLSPDGKYLAQVVIGDGEVRYLRIYRATHRGKSLIKGQMVSRCFNDVHGCVWIPRHRHWLAVSTGGADYGVGMVALWIKAKTKLRYLRHAKTDMSEGYNIRSVSANGQTLVYEHFGLNSPDPNCKRTGTLYLKIPRT